MPTPDISAVAEPTLGYVIITINWSANPTVLFAKVTRTLPDGTSTVVRPHTFTDSSGDYIELSSGLAVLYDTEAPLNTVLTYTTEGLGSALSATASTVILTSSSPWLKSPLHPWANKQLVLTPNSYNDLECLAGDSIVFASMAEETRAGQSSASIPFNAKFPIPSSRTRGSISSNLRLVTRTFAARDAVVEINASGDPLLFQAPSTYGIPDRYMTVGDYTVTRFSADHKKQWRANTLPHVEIDIPAGLSDGVLGVRWADVCDLYPTFADLTAAGITRTQILFGQAASPPSPTICDYNELAASYVDYTAMTAANANYTALLDC